MSASEVASQTPDSCLRRVAASLPRRCLLSRVLCTIQLLKWQQSSPSSVRTTSRLPPPASGLFCAGFLCLTSHNCLSPSCSYLSSSGVVVGDGAVGKVSLLPLPRRPPWCRSPLIELFKQDLSIDILHNKRFPCTHFPLKHCLIAAHVLSQSSRVNMSLLVRLQLPTGLHNAQLTSVYQYLTTIPVRLALLVRWMTCDVPSNTERQPR